MCVSIFEICGQMFSLFMAT